MRQLGRLMQIVALTAPPVGIVLQLMNVLSLKHMLILVVPAFCLFWIGRIVEGYSPP